MHYLKSVLLSFVWRLQSLTRRRSRGDRPEDRSVNDRLERILINEQADDIKRLADHFDVTLNEADRPYEQ